MHKVKQNMSLSNFVKRVRNIMRNDAGINGDAQRIEQMAWMLFLKVYDEKENDWELDDDDYKSIIPEECRRRNLPSSPVILSAHRPLEWPGMLTITSIPSPNTS